MVKTREQKIIKKIKQSFHLMSYCMSTAGVTCHVSCVTLRDTADRSGDDRFIRFSHFIELLSLS